MANPRDLADKAFTLLQDALRDSEARAEELDAELKRKRQPRTQVEERLEVVSHRLEKVEADCEQWRREAGHLEDLLRNERARVKQLRQKLSTAESGPDKLTRKEVNFWRQRAEAFNSETNEYKARIARLRHELKERADSAPLQQSLTDLEAANAELKTALDAAQSEKTRLEAAFDELRRELDDARAQRESRDGDSERDRERLAAETMRADSAEARLGELETRVDALTRELDEARGRLTQAESAHSSDVTERDRRIAELGAELDEARAKLDSGHSQSAADIADRDQRIESLTAELEDTRAQLKLHEHERAAEMASRDREVDGLRSAIEDAREEKTFAEQTLADLRRQLEQRNADADAHLEQIETELRAALETRERELAELRSEQEARTESLTQAHTQIEGLEAELREEKEVSENLTELANERRESLGKLQEKVEELEERYAEAEWRLGKARHFERLVKRRKGLIRNLIATIRAKHKSNTALKAGLDGLRTFKATAEANQQKLLQRIDKLKAEVDQAREKHAAQASIHATANDEAVAAEAQAASAAAERIAELELRLNTQAELIQSLETDLKAARAAQHSREDASAEVARLKEALDAKDRVISELEVDLDDQARKLSKLRGSETETMRLKALKEQDRGQIDALEQEIAALKAQLAEAPTAGTATDPAGLERKLRERDQSISRLVATLKDKDAEIAQLAEASESWKRKYQFLSSEAPDAYQSTAQR